jgi:hypothetical protein
MLTINAADCFAFISPQPLLTPKIAEPLALLQVPSALHLPSPLSSISSNTFSVVVTPGEISRRICLP